MQGAFSTGALGFIAICFNSMAFTMVNNNNNNNNNKSSERIPSPWNLIQILTILDHAVLIETLNLWINFHEDAIISF